MISHGHSHDDEGQASEALKSESKIKSFWYIMSPDGTMTEVDKFNFAKHEKLEVLAKYEAAKKRAVDEPPPHVKLMKKMAIADYEPASDSGNMRFYPNGRLIKSLLERFVTDQKRSRLREARASAGVGRSCRQAKVAPTPFHELVILMKILLQDIVKRFGTPEAVNHISLEIKDGELFTLLGPSGCGKTTILRLIGGFHKPDHGEIYFDGKAVTSIPPYERSIGMVFQNYALWPHMAILDNISYGLKLKKFPRVEVADKVSHALKLVNLVGLENRYPGQLSGGATAAGCPGTGSGLKPGCSPVG